MNVDASALLSLVDVRFGFPDKPDFLGPITLTIEPGQCWGIVGPNGAGKSTLLRLMAGLLRPKRGTVHLEGRPLASMPHRDRAKRVAFVPQRPPAASDISVRQTVLLGRHPHRSLGLFDSYVDQRIAGDALSRTGVAALADRPVGTLSGGEAQRVHLAAALAQEPALLLLDEPTAALDLRHQLAIFRILSYRTACPTSTVHRPAESDSTVGTPEQNGSKRERSISGPSVARFPDLRSVVVVTHDINLAARFCSHVLLLHEGRAVATGSPGEVLAPERLGPVYGVHLTACPVPGVPQTAYLVALHEQGGTG